MTIHKLYPNITKAIEEMAGLNNCPYSADTLHANIDKILYVWENGDFNPLPGFDEWLAKLTPEELALVVDGDEDEYVTFMKAQNAPERLHDFLNICFESVI